MYGYIRPDKDTLSVENQEFYYAHFCGLCKTAGKNHGQLSRFLVSYDITFLDIFMRAATGDMAEITEGKCVANLRKTRKIAAATELTKLVSDVSVLLGYLKLTDDIIDGGGFRRRLARRGIRRAYKQAKRAHGAFWGQIKALYEGLRACEAHGGQNIDAAAHYFAETLSVCAVYISDTQSNKSFTIEETEAIREMFYNLGKWIYIADAVDDLPEDRKTHNYNPLAGADSLDEARFVLGCCAAKIAGCYEQIPLSGDRVVLNNIIYRGLHKRAEKIFAKGESK